MFDKIIAGSHDSSGSGACILPEWGFEIMHEFVYQFQGFCQLRSKTNSSPEDVELLNSNKDCWAVETVMYYLHALINMKSSANVGKVATTLGLFASLSLSRLECLLGDFDASLQALDGIDLFSRDEMFYSLFPARLSLFYHAGVSYFVLRRYRDATKVMSKMVNDITRGFKTNQLKKLPGSEQFLKLNDKMVALLAIINHVQPSIKMDDSLLRTIAEKHGEKLAKIEAGEDGYEDLFTAACPKFVSPVVGDGSGCNLTAAAYRHQVQQCVSELGGMSGIPTLRSYLKLYTSIDVKKLATFNDCSEGELQAKLLAFKQKAMQEERGGEVKSTNDVHFYMQGDTVVVDNKRQEHLFDRQFTREIMNCEEICNDVGNIPSAI